MTTGPERLALCPITSTLTEQEYVRTPYAVRRQALSVADEAAIGRLDAVAIRVVEEP